MSISTSNITWDEIRDTLNENGGSVTNVASTAFKSSANINWAARYKPVPYAIAFNDEDSNWWKASDGKCGVDYPVYSKTSSVDGNDESSWSPNLPSGGEDEPFRLGDFAGYNPDAKLISSVSVQPSGDVNIGSSGTKSNLMIQFKDNINTNALDFSEIKYSSSKTLDDLYFGVVAIKTSGASHGVVSLSETMADGSDDHLAYVGLNDGIFASTGAYDLHPVLFIDTQDAEYSSSSFTCSDYIPLPIDPVRVNVVSPSVRYSAEITSVRLSGTTLTINYTFTTEGAAFFFGPSTNTPTLEVYAYTDIAEGSTIFPYSGNEFADFVNSYSIAADSTVNCSDTVNVLSASGYSYLMVTIRWDAQGVSAVKRDIAI